MKRVWAIIAIAVTVGAAVFGQETDAPASKSSSAFRLSLGVGGALDANLSTWFVDKDVDGDLNRYNSSSLGTAPSWNLTSGWE